MTVLQNDPQDIFEIESEFGLYWSKLVHRFVFSNKYTANKFAVLDREMCLSKS